MQFKSHWQIRLENLLQMLQMEKEHAEKLAEHIKQLKEVGLEVKNKEIQDLKEKINNLRKVK